MLRGRSRSTVGRHGKLRVLVVEDDCVLADNLRRALEAAEFDCDIALDGVTGFEKARSGEYDLVVLDIMLPAMSGFRVCADIRACGILVPILMVTAKAGEWDEAEGLDTGADDYLTKPVSMVVFLAHVRALIRRSKLFRNARLTVDGITLDPVRHVCAYRSAEVQLSGREVEVLAYLMGAEGSAVDKGELVVGVWGQDFDGDRNIAEVYVRHLRKKLEPAFGRRIVETVHGLGYRFCIQGT
jgi:two-component system, OmpR family, response regulator